MAGCDGDHVAAPPDRDDDLPVTAAQGLSPRPPMGWNSWNFFGCNRITEAVVRQVADAMSTNGMREAGYQYINIDDCWHGMERDQNGALQANAVTFPSGIKAIADYVHDKGLKLGIYSDRGTATCAGRPGSQDHEMQDAITFASWGVDYLKHDNCNAVEDAQVRKAQYAAMGEALAATGRDVVYSLCAWKFYEWGVGMGQLWRTTSDISDAWTSIIKNIVVNQSLAAYAGPNGWNDPDMLEVGNGRMTDTEYRAHFSLWAIMAAPLIAGNDVRALANDPATAAILLNKEVIALNQDELGLQGTQVRSDGMTSVWAKPLNENGARGVVLFNAGEAAADVTVTFTDAGLRAGSATVRDLWQGQDLGQFRDRYTTNVPAHGVAALRIKGEEPARPRAGTVFLSDLTWTYAAGGIGPVERDQNNGASAAGDGTPIKLRGTTFAKGLGMSSPAAVIFRLAGACSTFSATVGIDDLASGAGSAVFKVIADGETLYESPVLTGMSPPEPVNVSVAGKRRLKLLVTATDDGIGQDRASWGDARLECLD